MTGKTGVGSEMRRLGVGVVGWFTSRAELPLGQILPPKAGSTDLGLNIVWPADLATGKPIYPAP